MEHFMIEAGPFQTCQYLYLIDTLYEDCPKPHWDLKVRVDKKLVSHWNIKCNSFCYPFFPCIATVGPLPIEWISMVKRSPPSIVIAKLRSGWRSGQNSGRKLCVPTIIVQFVWKLLNFAVKYTSNHSDTEDHKNQQLEPWCTYQFFLHNNQCQCTYEKRCYHSIIFGWV